MSFKQEAFQKTLQAAFGAARAKNASYSLRAFARKLGITPSALSEILSGKRFVSVEYASKVLRNLGTDPIRIHDIVSELSGILKPERSVKKYVQLTTDQFRVISDWYHYGLLSLVETEGFKSKTSWIAQRLRIRPQEAQAAVSRLVRLRFLKQNTRGDLKRSSDDVGTSDGITDASIRNAHIQDLELIRRSLEENSIDERDSTAMTMAIDPDLLDEARARVRAFRDELCVFLESGKKKEVYKLSIHLYPLSDLSNSKGVPKK